MNQAIHILRKDVRHLLPELGVYMMVLIAYGWAEPFTWKTGVDPHSPVVSAAGLLLLILRPLIPLLWFLTISRLVHDESLVGDRQFWLTRPFNRISLAIAKVLFVFIYTALPFALMQAYLIAHAKLGVRQAVPDIFFNLRTLGLICWLPFVALATVTSSLVRMLLSAVGILLAFFLFTVFITLNLVIAHASPPFLDTIMATVFALVILGTILFQYTTRCTTASRLLLVAAFVVIGILRTVAPANLLFKLRYPSAPQRVSYDAARKPGKVETNLSPLHGRYVMTLPIQRISKSLVSSSEVASSYTIDTPYSHYASGWQRAGISPDGVSMYIASDTLARFRGSSTNLHVNVVGTMMTPAGTSSSDGLNQFDVLGNGHCLTDRNGTYFELVCRYAFASPPNTVFSEELLADPEKAHQLQARVASPSFDPIAEVAVALQSNQLPAHFSVTTYQAAERINVVLDASGVNMTEHLSSGLQ